MAETIPIKKRDQKYYNLLGIIFTEIQKYEQAKKRFYKAIDIDPNYFEPKLNLGINFINTGNLQDAKKILTAAVCLKKDHAVCNAALGAVLLELKLYDDVLGYLQKSVQLEKSNPNTWANLSKTFFLLNKLEEAERTVKKALIYAPGHTQALTTLAGIYQAQNDKANAILTLESLENINEPSSDIKNYLAMLHAELKNYTEAIRYYQEALEIDPKNTVALLAVTELLEKTNKLDDAKCFILKSIEQGIRLSSDLQYYQAKLEFRFDNTQKALEILEKVEVENISTLRKSSYFELLAKCHDNNRNFKSAFRNFQKMNEQIKLSKEFPNHSPLQMIRALNQNFSKVKLGSTPLKIRTQAIGIEPKLVFLIGFPRSGTTLLDTILRSHQSFQVIEEQPLIDTMRDKVLGIKSGQFFSNLSSKTITACRASYLEELQKLKNIKQDKKVIVDKLPLNILNVGLIGQVFPEATILLCIRHPFDCVLSSWMQNFQLNQAMTILTDLYSTAEFYDLCMKNYELYKTELYFNSFMIRYEDLVKDLRQTLEPLLQTLEIDWDDEFKQFNKTAERREFINTPSYSQIIKPLNHSAVNRWKNYEEELEEFKPLLEKWCKYYGYKL
ncbi:sulfotransferase [Paracoccaceae bacterium]|nr:sulfotransferase [Paracoccaceae bacterium]